MGHLWKLWHASIQKCQSVTNNITAIAESLELSKLVQNLSKNSIGRGWKQSVWQVWHQESFLKSLKQNLRKVLMSTRENCQDFPVALLPIFRRNAYTDKADRLHSGSARRKWCTWRFCWCAQTAWRGFRCSFKSWSLLKFGSRCGQRWLNLRVSCHWWY